jgi:6-phosphogluconolactonase (cycloisomerase 2 family)
MQSATALALVPLGVPVPALRAAAIPAIGYAFVGTYTPNGGGIYVYRLDRASGALTQLQVVDDVRNPSWLAVNPAQTRLYAVSEIDNFEGSRDGAVVSYAIDPESMQLTRLGAVRSGGTSPRFISVHPSGGYAFVANYGGGTVSVFPVAANGALGDASDVRPSVGAHHRARAVDDPPGQFASSDHDGAHPHMVAPDPSGQFVIANDAGLDLTLVWRFDAQGGRLLPAAVPVVAAASGSAPRHFAFHPSGRYLYSLCEHDARVVVYDYDGATGGMRHRQTIAALPPKFAGSILASEIVLTPDGRFLYVANRLHSGLAGFAVAATGELRMISDTWVRSDGPRSIAIDPSGELLYCCNQRGDSITSFRLNPSTGVLQFTGRFEPVGSPAFMMVVDRRVAPRVARR